MEAQQENPLQSSLKQILDDLAFDGTGRPINAEDVSAAVSQAVKNYFIDHPGDTAHSSEIATRFRLLGINFNRQEDLLNFLNLCASKIKEAAKAREQQEINEPLTIEDTYTDDEGIEHTNQIIDYNVSQAIGDAAFHLECLSEEIQLNSIEPIEEECKQLDPDLPIEIKILIAEKIRRKLKQLVESGKLFTKMRNPIPAENLNAILDSHEEILLHIGGKNFSSALNIIIQKMCALENEKFIIDQIGHVDKSELEKNRLKYGAKGANLLILQVILQKLRDIGIFPDQFAIPPFELIETEKYSQWQEGQDTTVTFKKIYEKWQGKPLIIRSSAVYSEDGEEVTGAGKYDSIPLAADATFEDFMKAVETVYKSTNNEKALHYRITNGVNEELMGLVIQERIEDPNLGHMDSTRTGLKGLTQIRAPRMKLPFVFNSRKTDDLVFTGSVHGKHIFKAAHIMPDATEFDTMDYIYLDQLLKLARILAQYYKQAVQIEYSQNFFKREVPYNILQVRPLPSKMFSNESMEFPKGLTPIAEFRAEGVCDLKLDILTATNDNRKKTGLVIFCDSKFSSNVPELVERALPQKGAVLILNSSVIGKGHIETQAREIGLVVLIADEDYLDPVTSVALGTGVGIAMNFGVQDFYGHTRVRIVANGIKGNIYNIDSTIA